jgi:hypothetical protein
LPEARGIHELFTGSRGVRGASRLFSILGHVLVFGLALFGSNLLVERFGFQLFIILLIVAFVGSIYAILSFRNMSIPFAVWILSIGGFKFLLAVQVPGLPDLYLDRVAMIWLTLIFMVKFFAEGRSFKRPYLVDGLIILHGSYILLRIYTNDMQYFHLWTVAYLTPYSAYFLAKNIVQDAHRTRLLLRLLLILSIYYNITSVAEKFDIDFLLWPRYMVTEHEVFKGRSSGPFRQAPLFGTVLGLLLPIHLYFMAEARNKILRYALFLSLGLGFAGLYFTYTRGSWLAGFAALATVLVLNWRRYLKMVGPFLVLVPVLAFLVLGASQDTVLKERVENQNTLDARVGTLATAIRVWQDNPVFGVGFFQYQHVREDYIRALEVPVLGTIRFTNFRHNSIHDIYLGPLAEEGLFGFGLQMAIFIILIRTFLRKYRNRADDHFGNLMMPVLAGICAGYLAGGIAIDYRFFSVTGTLFYMSAGIIYGYSCPVDPNPPQKIKSWRQAAATQGAPNLPESSQG